jgi:hypothetical protein
LTPTPNRITNLEERDRFSEKIVIVRVKYADGREWHEYKKGSMVWFQSMPPSLRTPPPVKF